VDKATSTIVAKVERVSKGLLRRSNISNKKRGVPVESFREVPTIGVILEVKNGMEYGVLPEFRVVCPPKLRVEDSFTLFSATTRDGAHTYDGRHATVTNISCQYSGKNPHPLLIVMSVELDSRQGTCSTDEGCEVVCETTVCNSHRIAQDSEAAYSLSDDLPRAYACGP